MIKRFRDLFSFRVSLGKGTPVRDLPAAPSNLADRADVKTLKDLKEVITTKKQIIKIALDQNIGSTKSKALKHLGYDVVTYAKDAEKDRVWLNRAFVKGALFVVSPDLDIPNLIEEEKYPMIWIDYLHYGKDSMGSVEYVHKRIQSKLQFLKNQFGGGS